MAPRPLGKCHVPWYIYDQYMTQADKLRAMFVLWTVILALQVAELMTINAGPHPANKARFDRSGEILAIASDDGLVKCWNLIDAKLVSELKGHEDSVHAVVFDPFGNFLVSAGSDNTFRLFGSHS